MPSDSGGETEYGHDTKHTAHAHAHAHSHEAHLMLEQRGHYNGKAVAAFVLGLGGFVMPIIPSILAIVFGHSARDDLRMDHTQRGDGLALAGLILGYVGLGLAVVFLMAAFVFL